jgi:alpha-tubulin suppressor-like RCC1 family protein
MPNQFLSPEGDLENYFVTEYQLIDQYIGDELWTWGQGAFGQLGTNDTTQRNTPVTTSAGGTNWKQVSSGYRHCAAIKTDGTLWTWGQGAFGQLGGNTTTSKSTPVTTFAGETNWKQVSAGKDHCAAIKTDGTLWTWGRGTSGQLGTNDTTNKSTPVTTFVGGTNWKQVSSGGYHTAAIKTDGTLWTWGSGTDGRLGRSNASVNRLTPVTTFAGGTNWADTPTAEPEDLYTISASEQTAAIKTDGTLWTWGPGNYGQLGTNDTTQRNTPVTTFAGGTNWKQVSSSNQHTAAIKTDGTLWTWGAGSYGRLGTNATTQRNTPVTTFAGGTNWKQVSAGFRYCAAIKTDGTLWTWGAGSYGRLGTNATTNKSTPVTTFAGGTNWKQVSTCFSHCAAIKTDGTLWTWGLGSDGRLGNGVTTGSISTPVTTFAGGTDWKQVSVGGGQGGGHCAAIKTDGTLWTWGRGDKGQLGDNTTTSKSTPVTTFAGGTNWKQVSSNQYHCAAIKTDGSLWTWGYGNNGRLGTNDTTQRLTPSTTFAGGTNWKQVSSGTQHTAALLDDGVNKQLFLFGSNDSGKLGFPPPNIIPDQVEGNSTNWKQVSTGSAHCAAIKTDGTLWTWGNGGQGRLGNNDNTTRDTPVTTFAGGTNWKQVISGGYQNAAIKTDGTLWTWGSGTDGRLGRSNGSVNILTPVTTFAGGTNWADTPTAEPEDLYTISAGNQTAAIKTDGTLWTWGLGTSGQLGNDTATSRNTPVTTFAGGTNWKQVSSGGYHCAAIKTDGTLWTWGRNNFGQLGVNDTTQRNTPVTTFAGGTNWKQVSSGGNHCAAIKTDGTLWTWGYNGYSGRLGTNDNTTRNTPVTTFAGGTNWKQVSAGDKHCTAIKTDGTLWTWGSGFQAQLGVNQYTYIITPVTTFAGGNNWKQVSSGNACTAAIKTDGTLWTWGSGFSGELGVNQQTSKLTPVTTFAGGTNWKQVSVGKGHCAAIKTDGTLWTWGSGSNGTLGNNSTTNRLTPVTTFAGGTNWKQVSAASANGYSTVALLDDGVNKQLFLFGTNSGGQLGFLPPNIIPDQVEGNSTNWKQVSVGSAHCAAIKTDGTLWTWGAGADGKLGTNDTTNRVTPVTTFVGGTNWKQVSSGSAHSAAVTAGISPEYPLS